MNLNVEAFAWLFSPERFRVLVMALLVASAVAAVAKVFT